MLLSLVAVAVFAGYGCSGGAEGGQEAINPAEDLGSPGAALAAPDAGRVPDIAEPAPAVDEEPLAAKSSPLGGPCSFDGNRTLIINEFMADPDGGGNIISDAHGEWIEIFNPGATPIDLQGYRIHDERETLPDNHTIGGSLIVPAFGYVVLCRNADPAMNGGVTCNYQFLNFVLTNSADQIVLRDPQDQIVDVVRYTGQMPVGFSVALRNPALEHENLAVPLNPGVPASWNGLNWGISSETFGVGDKGTPGARNESVWIDVEDSECNDNVFCTTDTCNAGFCGNVWRDGCCTANRDCNDGNVCTSDSCDTVNKQCKYTPIAGCCTANEDCEDDNPCNRDYCYNNQCRFSAYNIVPGCCYAPAAINPLTGQPWSSPAERQAYAASQCDDKQICTSNNCNLDTNECFYGAPQPGCCTVNEECDDSDSCTWDLCIYNQCYNNRKSADCCVTAADCQDNNPCTVDTCVNSRCRNLFSTDQCCFDNAFCEQNFNDGNPCTRELCVQNPLTNLYECVHAFDATCQMGLPFVERFEAGSTFQDIGWKIVDYGTRAVQNWLLHSGSDIGFLGPDRRSMFHWHPTTVLVKSVMVSPLLDARTAQDALKNPHNKTTVQWRMVYRHAQPGTPVTLRVVATDQTSFGGNFLAGEILASWTVDTDIEYDLYSVELPNSLKFSANLMIGFMVDTGTSSTFNLESWEIDDVVVGGGVANHLLKARIYRCAPGAVNCTDGSGAQFIQEVVAPDPMPDLNMDVCEWYQIRMCFLDPDGRYTNWTAHGFPTAYLDTFPLDNVSFAGLDSLSGGTCFTEPFAVRGACDVPAQSDVGYYVCMISVKPSCNDANAGSYRVGLVSKDESREVSYSKFESLTKMTVNVTLDGGYIIWAPNGASDPAAIALREAILASGRRVQIIPNLDLLSDLSRFDGIFATLGVYGRSHAVTPGQAAKLAVYLDNGGRLYVEGGDFFFTGFQATQPATSLHPYFKTDGTLDGTSKQDGPVQGSNFLVGYGFDLNQSPVYNSWNDRLAHSPGLGGRQILRNAGARIFASAVSYDAIELGGAYRTIGSSVLFGGLVRKDGGRTLNELMSQYLNFLENGYPDCSVDSQCEDFEVCTVDSCGTDSPRRCVNELRPDCTPCLDDKYRPDGGTPSCAQNEACNIALGYCVPIDGTRFDIDLGSCDKPFGGSPFPTQAACVVSVPQPGLVQDLNVKVKVNHTYRGDIRLELKSPGNRTVMLKQENPADSARHVYFTYDAGLPATGDLDDFNGFELNGQWTLTATDTDMGIYIGLLEQFHVFAQWNLLACVDEGDCPPADYCTTYACVDELCQPTQRDCDDGLECTIDSCDPIAEECTHTPIPFCGGECLVHGHCGEHEACLKSDETATCDPLVDVDSITGESSCRCAPIPGVPSVMAGLPVPIPDGNPAGIARTQNLSLAGYVKDLFVKVRTNHTAQGQLKAELCHGSVCVMLRSYRGGPNQGFWDVYDFDAISGPGELNDFERLPLAGAWTLTVTDIESGEVGTLDNFTIYTVAADCYNNAECDDGNPCTMDHCQNPTTGGTCIHTAVQCQPTGDACTVNQCNPANGLCGPVAQPNGTPCEDGFYCSEDDACMAGVCTGGSPRNCAFLDDTCIVGTCSEDLKQCIPMGAVDGSACNDGQICTGGDFCETGVCQPGPELLCRCPSGTDAECMQFEDGNKCNGSDWRCNANRDCELADGPVVCPPGTVECEVNVCDSFDGVCKPQQALNFMPCQDGLFCTVADYCLSGACQAGISRECTQLDGDCAVGSCDEGADACVSINRPNGTICERDGFGCSIDQCLMGTCVYKENVSCSTVADDCNDGVCQNVGWGGWVCVKGPLPDGTVCDDEPNPCTDDKCQAGWCVHTLLPNCNGPCGGQHLFDAGDNTCGFEDSCEDGMYGYPNGRCIATCEGPNCVKAESGYLGLPVSETYNGGCTTTPLTIATGYQFVESVEAKVLLDHEYLGDLTVELISPQGYSHRMWNFIGGSNQDFANTFDVSMPVPYPGIQTSGIPMCAFRGEQANGQWNLRVCDFGAGASGTLNSWKLYVKGSNDPNLNRGHRCEDPIDLGSLDLVPAISVDGTTECALNQYFDYGCGNVRGPERLYKVSLETPKRVTIRLFQPDRDLVLFLKSHDQVTGTCAAGSIQCSQGTGAGATPEELDLQLQPGIYYIGLDEAGGMFNYGAFRFEIRVKSLLPDGANCVSLDLGPQDLDCLSQHCQNGYCCLEGDCCPGNEWPVPPDGMNPETIKTNLDWISANGICPAQYKADPLCWATDFTNPLSPVNVCQGERFDANCVSKMCVKTRVDDDVACDNSVESNRCGFFRSIFCGDYGPAVPGAQYPPPCPIYCETNLDCDANAHCDPAVATSPDPVDGYDPVQGVALKWCQADLPNGAASNEDSDCISNHSQNGYCCDSGDCCPTANVAGALTCPASYYVAPSCSDSFLCEGSRKDPICSDNICGSITVHDDCACAGSLSDNCGLYIPTFCPDSSTLDCPTTPVGGGEWHAGKPPCLDSCMVGGTWDDSKCDDIAHCDPCNAEALAAGDCRADQLGVDFVCRADIPNGYPCDRGGQCENKAWVDGNGNGIFGETADGHCQNGFCCDYGDCCANNTDCPFQSPPSAYWAAPSCDDAGNCQGHRMDASCDNSICGSVSVDDDTACDTSVLSDDCNYYLPVYCNGELVQPLTGTACPTTCLVEGVERDDLCDPDGHCDPDPAMLTNSVCMSDLPNDQYCDEASDCVSSYCQLHYCCDEGLCCKGCRVTNALTNLGMGSVSGTGDEIQAVSSWGQPSPVGRLEATAGNRPVDLGFLTGTVIPVYCYDLTRNVTETDTDCGGGTCNKCANGQACAIGSRDCVSGNCANGACVP
jgi:subtilisin-like proprotein convertase family protein